MKCAKEFITDINDLCDTCPIHTTLKEERHKTEFAFKRLKEINSPDFIKNYLTEKIKRANFEIEEVIKHEGLASDIYREDRVSLFLHWKDCVLYFTEQLENIEKQPLNKEKKISAPVIALFCRLVNESAILKKGDETITKYCQKVCNDYKLNYTDRVRQNFSDRETRENIQKVKDLILPIIDKSVAEVITQYLDKNS